MTSHTARPPYPPPPEDTRVPSPTRADSPPAPNQTSSRQDAPEVSPVDADTTRPVDISTEPAASSVNPEVSLDIPSTPTVFTATPTLAEDTSISAPSET